MNACVVGLGETGAAIVSLLNHHLDDSNINILDPSENIAGRFLDLAHATSFKDNILKLNDFNDVSDSDFLFFCAGFRNAKDGDRLSVAKQNKNLIKVVFDKLSLKKECKIIVLTNPVDLITKWINEYFSRKQLVIGTGTDLDTYRLKYILSQESKSPLSDVNIDVIGEHGQTMVPLYSSGSIKGKKITNIFNTKQLNQITEELKNAAKNIRKTEEATKYGVAQCAIELMEALNSNESFSRNISFTINSHFKELLEIDSDISIGIPCLINNSGVRINNDITLDNKEIELLKLSANKLIQTEIENN